MEAMTAGTIVVTSRQGGIPEPNEDGVTGYLVQKGNPTALSEKIQQVMKEKDRWPEIARAGRKKVEQEFEIETQADYLPELIREPLDKRGSRHG
jgi:glycosyltransferase involved in cell wall biosynthesis